MYLLFDIGGTNFRLALSRDGKELALRETHNRPQVIEEAMKLVEAFCQKNIELSQLKGVAGGIAGMLDDKKETLFNAPNIKEWEKQPLRKILESVVKMPVLLRNDADMAGLGEAVFGAGKGMDIVVYLTISTGVGGTRVVNKKLDKSAGGFEPGHQIIIPEGVACLCGGKGHLEAYVSGSSVERRFHKRPYEIIDASFWDKMAQLLANGLYNTIVHWSPDIVVLGGSMMKQVGIPLDRIEFHLRALNHMFPTLPLLQKSAFGDESGLYGALALLGHPDYNEPSV